MSWKVRSFVAVTISFLAACDDSAPLTSPVVQPGPVQQHNPPPIVIVPDASVVIDASVVAEAGLAPPKEPVPEPTEDSGVIVIVDAGAPTDAPTEAPLPPPQPITCPALAAGGKPDRLKDLQWMYQVGPVDTGFNRPYDTVTFDKSCSVTYVSNILPRPQPPAPSTTTRSAVMSAADCTAARAWVTNARFLEVLRTSDGCAVGSGNPRDVFDLTLTDEGRVARKTDLCPEPTAEAVRACLRPLISKLFPN